MAEGCNPVLTCCIAAEDQTFVKHPGQRPSVPVSRVLQGYCKGFLPSVPKEW